MKKLHLGCGLNVKDGYLNIDAYVEGQNIIKADILDLPFENNSVDEVLSEHMFEHIPFKDEEQLFRECYRVLKPNGKLIIEVPDMEWLCKKFMQQEDDFREFYKVGSKDHYFGTYRSIEHRWGITTTHFFGNQNGPGQFHYNGYTKSKLIRISTIIGFTNCEVLKILNKGAQVLVAKFTK